MHPASAICIIAFIFPENVEHGIRQRLIFPWPGSVFQIFVEPLPADVQQPAIEGQLPFVPAVVHLVRNEPHSGVLADFRRLAAKKALASSKNSFSSFKRRISLA